MPSRDQEVLLSDFSVAGDSGVTENKPLFLLLLILEGLLGSLCSECVKLCATHLTRALSLNPPDTPARHYPMFARVHAKLCLILCDLMDGSLPGSSVHGILQQEYWSGLPFSSPGCLPDLENKPASLTSPALTVRFFNHSHCLGRSPCQGSSD